MFDFNDIIVFDLESDGLLDTITKIHCLCSTVGDAVGMGGDLESLLERLEAAPILAGHNIISFDIPAIQKFYPWFRPTGLLLDTKILAQLVMPDVFQWTFAQPSLRDLMSKDLWARQSLKAWGYRLGFLKGEPPEFAEYSPAMLTYCQQDVRVTQRLLEFLLVERAGTSESAVRLEMAVARVIQRQKEFGVMFNQRDAEKLAANLMDELKTLKFDLQVRFPPWQKLKKEFIAKVSNKKLGRTKGDHIQVFEEVEFNPASNAHVLLKLREEYGWEPVVFTEKGNPKLDEEILNDLGHIPEVADVIKYRTANKILSYVSSGDKSWLKYVRPDGRIYGDVQSCGAGTRRMTHNSPNLGQVPSNRAYMGTECRQLFSAPPGWIMLGADADQLELRTLAHFVAPYDGGAYVRAATSGSKEGGTDIHSVNAKLLGVSRDTVKTIFYAWLYGAGLEKLGRIITKSWDRELNIREGRKIKRKLETRLTGIMRLREDLLRTLAGRKYLVDLDGQPFRIRSQHSALNELNQRAGATIMKRFQVTLDEMLVVEGLASGADYEFMLTVHDEVQLACASALSFEIIPKVIPQAFEAVTRYYRLRCPITGTSSGGATWAETH